MHDVARLSSLVARVSYLAQRKTQDARRGHRPQTVAREAAGVELQTSNLKRPPFHLKLVIERVGWVDLAVLLIYSRGSFPLGPVVG